MSVNNKLNLLLVINLLLFIAVLDILTYYYPNKQEEKKVEVPIAEDKEVKSLTHKIDSIKEERGLTKKHYEMEISNHLRLDDDSTVIFFEGYVSKYRLGKDSDK